MNSAHDRPTRSRLPPLSTLHVFEVVARLGSVTRAAEELGRTHGAVSRQLRSLHERAGISFFDREGTGIRLNRHGQALRDVVAAAFEDLEQGWQRVLAQASGEALHVACSATFAMRWLVPRLAGLYRENPELKIRLSMTSAREIRQQGADLIIAWDLASYSAADVEGAVPLAPVNFGPVCAPAYAFSLADRRLSFETRIAHEFTSRAWTGWQELSGVTTLQRFERGFPHTHLCIEAAAAGLGLALVEQRMVTEELASGRLIAPCGFAPFPDKLSAIPMGARGQTKTARMFVDWLTATLTAEAERKQPESRTAKAARHAGTSQDL
ncbi:LysR substrate-binding domain-containing protein [Bosea sp. WAO]|uniref:LysR substrate-binding domain-containing protein n=1 Tax=Bosea sp. WAO TaxID=406341 RepID=UPI0020BDAF6D|nr:LysR substrate-binding domain-containing protein [Bosea sp. WAO]